MPLALTMKLIDWMRVTINYIGGHIMRVKGKDINKQIILTGYVFPGDRKTYNQYQKSVILYKRKIDRFMIPAQFTISPSKYVEYHNYYILTK